jgi:hypothetical protein
MTTAAARFAKLALTLACAVLGSSVELASAGEPERISDEASLETVREALRAQDAFSRSARLAALLPRLGPEAAGQVPALLKDVTLEVGVAETALLVRLWAAHDPRAATEWALLHSHPPRRAAAVDSAVERWAREDPGAALQELRARAGPSAFGEVAQVALVRGWFDGGKPGLVDHIRDLGVGIERQRALATFVRRTILRKGPEAAVGFAESVPPDDDKYKLEVMPQTGSELAIQHPEIAAAWCERVCANEDGVRTLVAQRWAARSGLPALEWASPSTLARIDPGVLAFTDPPAHRIHPPLGVT